MKNLECFGCQLPNCALCLWLPLSLSLHSADCSTVCVVANKQRIVKSKQAANSKQQQAIIFL